jgi:hypothetical protein
VPFNYFPKTLFHTLKFSSMPMIKFKQKPVDDTELINIFMLTRGRPEKVVVAIRSLDRLANKKNKIELWIYIDNDDIPTLNLMNSDWCKGISIGINWHIGSRPITHGAAFTELWNVSSNAAMYMGFSDDYVVQTSNWDVAVRETFLNVPNDRIAIGYLSDPLMPKGGVTFMVETAEWINQVGYFVVPYFPYWFGDIWLQQIAEMVERKYAIPVNVWPLEGEKGKTLRLWDLPFWTYFFNILLAERVETAIKIIERLTSDNLIARECAIANMYEKITEIEETAKAGQSSRGQKATQLDLTQETKGKDETYLTALRQGQLHLEAMMPKIQEMEMRQVFWNKQKIFVNRSLHKI